LIKRRSTYILFSSIITQLLIEEAIPSEVWGTRRLKWEGAIPMVIALMET
jgi:hypothetical protein